MSINRKHTMGYIVNTDTNGILKFQYNPPEWAVEDSVKYGDIESPGAEYPRIFYQGGERSVIQLTLDFYFGANSSNPSYSNGGELWEQIKTYTQPRTKAKNMIKGSNHFISPPICLFVWSSETYKFVAQKVRRVKKMFNPNLSTRVISVEIEMLLIK